MGPRDKASKSETIEAISYKKMPNFVRYIIIIITSETQKGGKNINKFAL